VVFLIRIVKEELVPSLKAGKALQHQLVEGIGVLHPVVLLLVVMFLVSGGDASEVVGFLGGPSDVSLLVSYNHHVALRL